MKFFSMLFLISSGAISLVGCGHIPGYDTGYTGGGFEEAYDNDVYLDCNGYVLVDEYFDSRDECERYRDQYGPWECYGAEISFNC